MLMWSMSRIGSSSKPVLEQLRQRLGGDLVAGLGEDLAGLRIEEVLGEILAVEILVRHADRLHALLGELARGAHGELLAGLEHDLAGLGVDHVGDGLDALACARRRTACASSRRRAV